jgi:hypothetical protein
MHLPRDQKTRILVRTPVTVINESDAHIQLELLGMSDGSGKRVTGSTSLPPGSRTSAYAVVDRTLAEWVDVYNARKLGGPGDDGISAVAFNTPSDTGAIDRWAIHLGGTVVEPVPDMEGAWRLIETPDRLSGKPGAVGVGAVLRDRTYYLSKSRNQQLLEPTGQTEQ